MDGHDTHSLTAIDMGIDTHQEPIVYMRQDCEVCRSEGFRAHSRVEVATAERHIVATQKVVDTHILPPEQAGLSKAAMKQLGLTGAAKVTIRHAPVIESLARVRKKLYGHPLAAADFDAIIGDIVARLYSDIEIAAFISGCASQPLTLDEVIGLTRAMVKSGQQLHWPDHDRVFDKHCVGGLPGNRTSPLIVAMVSAAGYVMPKTSSRAITSPAGTADTLETLFPVELELAEMQRVVREVGACLAWGGTVNLSPADDRLIRIERALNLDSEGQLIASVLSKKIAAGSTHVVIDLPVGRTAKVRSHADAHRLVERFTQVGDAFGLRVRCVQTDGASPVGRGIGPVEEARDVLAVLQGDPRAPADLRDRAVLLAGHLFDLAEGEGLDAGQAKARTLLTSGAAWAQFQRIAQAQGGLRTLPSARHHSTQMALKGGVLSAIDNRRLARLAKLAGAPFSPGAGLRLRVPVGDRVEIGQPLFTLFAHTRGELDYALAYYERNPDLFTIREVDR